MKYKLIINNQTKRVVALILTLALLIMTSLACGLSAPSQPDQAANPSGTAISNEPLPTDPGQPASTIPPEQSSQTTVEVAIAASDPCSLLTKEQVETAFGKSTQTFGPQQPSGNVISCKGEFTDGSIFYIDLFEREIDKQQFATHIAGYQKGCLEGMETYFEIFNPDFPPTPSTDVAALMSANSLGELYLMENDFFPACWFSVKSNASELGANVYVYESVLNLLGWHGKSDVAVVNDDKVVSFRYVEETPDMIAQELNKVTGLDSFYVIAEPYRQQVLSGYSEILLGLLKQAVGK
jgi:hypothetical protein